MNIKETIKSFAERRRAIRQLQMLDDHELRDMGISRSEIRQAVKRR